MTELDQNIQNLKIAASSGIVLKAKDALIEEARQAGVTFDSGLELLRNRYRCGWSLELVEAGYMEVYLVFPDEETYMQFILLWA